MSELPEFLERGEVARLIPVAKDSQKEDRATSILMAGVMSVNALAKALLSEIGPRIGTRARVSCYTQVVYKKLPSDIKHRPDGLIEVVIGSNVWCALIESKIGTNELEEEQIRDYLQIAKFNAVNAVITISNQFAVLPTHHPIKLRRAPPRGVELFHWSWMWIVTQAMLLLQDSELESPDQRYILQEIVRYFQHPSGGVSGFVQMNPEWKELVAKVQTGGSLNKTSDEVTKSVASWHQEGRDLCLIMSRALGRNVSQKLSRTHARDASLRLKNDSEELTNFFRLSMTLEVPDAAAPINVIADLRRRTVICSMKLEAPSDRKGATARTNWLLRQIKETDSPNILINANWPSRSPVSQAALDQLRGNPKLIESGKEGLAPQSFEVLMVRDLAGKFSGRKTFIEFLESIVPEFYEEVGQHLRPWIALPPKIESRAKSLDVEKAEATQNPGDSSNQMEKTPNDQVEYEHLQEPSDKILE